jgi:hypothetical protein
MSALKNAEDFVTMKYCELCRDTSAKAIVAASILLDEKIKSIKILFVVGFSLTTLIISVVELLLKFRG